MKHVLTFATMLLAGFLAGCADGGSGGGRPQAVEISQGNVQFAMPELAGIQPRIRQIEEFSLISQSHFWKSPKILAHAVYVNAKTNFLAWNKNEVLTVTLQSFGEFKDSYPVVYTEYSLGDDKSKKYGPFSLTLNKTQKFGCVVILMSGVDGPGWVSTDVDTLVRAYYCEEGEALSEAKMEQAARALSYHN